MYLQTIAQVDAELTGIHLLWSGPAPWVYAPGGWSVERAVYSAPRLSCETLTAAQLEALRANRELLLSHGVATLRAGQPSAPLSPGGPAMSAPVEVVTLRLATPRPWVRLNVAAKQSQAMGLRDGKVVAATALGGASVHELRGAQLDAVVLYAHQLNALAFCSHGARTPAGFTQLAQLQLPLRELDGALHSFDDEYARARSRLLPNEELDRDEFQRLAELLRRLVVSTAARPIDQALLVRAAGQATFDEVAALDPLRAVLPHPRWRRALGLGYCDRDPALVPGTAYEYRVTGKLPGDRDDVVLGFHTVPTSTPLPDDFHLGETRVRLPRATPVALSPLPGPGDPAALAALARRGVALSGQREPFWLGDDLEGWSAVIDFPRPVSTVILEVAEGHSLRWAAGAAWIGVGAEGPVPAGTRPQLSFPTPVHQLRLSGAATLYALRLPAAAAPNEVIALCAATLVDQPRPPAPLALVASNLQVSAPPPASELPAAEPQQHQLGLRVQWRPAPIPGLAAWPPDLPPPPVDAALFQLEHRQVATPPGAWRPVLTDDNLTLGSRDLPPEAQAVARGADLLALYPETGRAAAAGALELHYDDVFDFPEGGEPVLRPPPPPGTSHEYRIRAVDGAGRAGTQWRQSNAVRLEKRVPPPLPAAATPAGADELARPQATGVTARVLVQGAPDLTDAERALLGSHGSAIILRWGWRARERQQDPYASEFRVYKSRARLDGCVAALTTVTTLGAGLYRVALTLDRAVVADSAVGLRYDCSGGAADYSFEITAHTAGTSITADLRARVPLLGGAYPVPTPGPGLFPQRLTPDRTRAPAWGPRVEIVPITAARTEYESQPIFDFLQLDAAHPEDRVMVGVSTADAEGYVADPLEPVEHRAGNESAIVAVECRARFYGRPILVETPGLAPVPTLRTAAPGRTDLEAAIDLRAFLPGTPLTAGEPVYLERVDADEVAAAYRVDGERILARVLPPALAGDAEVELSVANPGDRAVLLAALRGGRAGARHLDARFLVFLAQAHPTPSRLFTAHRSAAAPLDVVTEVLPARGTRWLYRARRAAASGARSLGGAVLRGVVEVPSSLALSAPLRGERQAGDLPSLLRLRVNGGSEVTSVLTFAWPVTAAAQLPELLIAPGQAPIGQRVRLRFDDGSLLTPLVHPMSGAAVSGEVPYRELAAALPLPAGASRVWAAAASDLAVSPLGGAWLLRVPPSPLAAALPPPSSPPSSSSSPSSPSSLSSAALTPPEIA